MTYPDATIGTFSYHDLTVQVTNAREIKQSTMRLDENLSQDYDIFVVYSGAEISVVSAGMAGDVDGMSFPNWRLYFMSGAKQGLEYGMPPIAVDDEVIGIGADSVCILCFEVYDTAEKGA